MARAGIFGRLTGLRGPGRWAVAASLAWVVIVLAYGIGFLSVAAATESRGTVVLDALFFLVALALPLGLIWLAAWLAEELARQREVVAALAEVAAPLIAAMDETRAGLAQHASPEEIARVVGAAVGEAVAGMRPVDVSRPLADLAAAQARLEAKMEAWGTQPTPVAAPEARSTAATPAPAPDIPAAAAAADEPPAPALGWDQLIRALDFPRDAGDREGFRALKAAQKQPKLGQTLQAAEDVLNLLSQEGIFVDELPLAEVEPSAWRRFMGGLRGAKAGAIGGITDPQALAVAGRLLHEDAVFRDTAMFFLRRFERVLAEYARDADDDALVALAGTRSGRAFMILARSSGTFS
ncbi:MAG: hypothetical protein QM699_03815 [Amaricoccus sp.]|uniref:hypothetical protein n=1 Tax=Amaricoccus sp. TaxID=1872485 RepID=UPI0039E53820